MNRTTARTRHTTPPPIDRTRLTLRRAEERAAWQALVADGDRLADCARAPHYAPLARRMYAESLLTWRAARHALDLALVPVPPRPARSEAVSAAPSPRPLGRRPRAKRAWWRPVRG